MNKSAERKCLRDSQDLQLHNYILVRPLRIKRASGLGMSDAVFLSDFLTQLAVRTTDMIQLLHSVRYEVTAQRFKNKAKARLSIEHE